MKGTAPRGRWAAEDAEHAAALSTSAKERAENIMVVDLLRNDMGRIAETGSVAVPQLWRVERHPSVWQLTSTVTARTPPETRLADVFGALFPCASVTGAPKISAMAIIADLEARPSRRLLRRGRVDSTRPVPFEASRRFRAFRRRHSHGRGRQGPTPGRVRLWRRHHLGLIPRVGVGGSVDQDQGPG